MFVRLSWPFDVQTLHVVVRLRRKMCWSVAASRRLQWSRHTHYQQSVMC